MKKECWFNFKPIFPMLSSKRIFLVTFVCIKFSYMVQNSVAKYFTVYVNESRHDKTNNVAVRSAKTQISLGIRPV